MIPKPPFADQLSLADEIANFRETQARFVELWDAITFRDEEPHTSVVVPSMTLDQAELKKLDGASFYEERLLFLLIRLRNPRANVVYVTSQPVHPLILEYYFELLAGIPTSHARKRLTLLCAYDASPRSLTQKILERPRLLERIRAGIPDRNRAYLTVFNSTPLERKLAVLLGIPINGIDPELAPLGTKSGNRKIFAEAGVAYPAGMEDLRDEPDVAEALYELGRKRPGLRKAVVKLNDSFSGEGNAIFRYPADADRRAIGECLPNLEFAVPTENFDHYFDQYRKMGGIVEEFLEGEVKTSPSVQLRTDPHGEPMVISTHDQILGGPTGQVFLGCQFPASDDYRRPIQDLGLRIGRVLGEKGVVSRFAIDFLAVRGDDGWEVSALEINLRMGGTTHPYLALQFLTGGRLEPETGLFHSPSGLNKFYRATDNLKSDHYRGLLPDDLIEILTINRLHYDHRTETGVLFHLMGALSEFGKIGATAIGNTREEAEIIYARALDVLDRETALGR